MEHQYLNYLNASDQKFKTQINYTNYSSIQQKQHQFYSIFINDQLYYPCYGNLTKQKFGNYINSTNQFYSNASYHQNFGQQKQPKHIVISNNHQNNLKRYKTQKRLCKSFLQTFKTIMKLNLNMSPSKIYYQQALQPIRLSPQSFIKINQYLQLQNKKLNIPLLNKFIQIPEIRVLLSQMFKTYYLQRQFQNRRITQKHKGKFLKKLTYLRKAVIQGKLKRLA